MAYKGVTVQAYANIALDKYWGKRDDALFLPTKNSLSVTLSGLKTSLTMMRLPAKQDRDVDDIILYRGKVVSCSFGQPIINFLKKCRKMFKINDAFMIDTVNSFPVAAGIASSSSGFAALAAGINGLCNLNLDNKQLSILARQGSGSACRSIPGGFSLWEKGVLADGSDSFARQLFSSDHWPQLRIVTAVIDARPKKISSRQAMELSVKTSKRYQTWLQACTRKESLLIRAIYNKNIKIVGKLMQSLWVGFFDVVKTTDPPINYWSEQALHVINQVLVWQNVENIPVFFTTDAGPNIVLLCEQDVLPEVLIRLKSMINVQEVIVSTVGVKPQVTFI